MGVPLLPGQVPTGSGLLGGMEPHPFLIAMEPPFNAAATWKQFYLESVPLGNFLFAFFWTWFIGLSTLLLIVPRAVGTAMSERDFNIWIRLSLCPRGITEPVSSA
ncbi:hypothetical protein CYMTET_14343 [Cymbomonas tetramitiformis]|uniref:Uncharacterized protein n=1 Tax=Cymbomonas tetramitiformis TaxID=36881 RepID=A0AAE0LA99_9CHLO|nr:hypothetical protein CYMTET_14343 [Cymbomonas tetramitiformis]